MSLESDYIAAITAGDLDTARHIGAQLDAQDAERDAAIAADPHWLAKAAVWYATQGIPVFPVAANSKRPALPRAHRDEVEQSTCQGQCGADGHGLYDASTDVERVRQWWVTHPTYNIGMPTGRLWDVIDVDGPEGVKSIWGTRSLGGCLADTLDIVGRVNTPREAGRHLYIAPTGLGNSTQLYAGCDYRGIGGYVLLPPSVIENKMYHWLAWPEMGAA